MIEIDQNDQKFHAKYKILSKADQTLFKEVRIFFAIKFENLK